MERCPSCCLHKLITTPAPLATPLYAIPEENGGQQYDVPKDLGPALPFMKLENYQYFGPLLNEDEGQQLTTEYQKEKNIMKFLLKVKDVTPCSERQHFGSSQTKLKVKNLVLAFSPVQKNLAIAHAANT